MFFQLDRLRRCLPGRIRRALDELPDTLDETYERTLLDINEDNWAYAHRLFQCITVASRPLRVEELAEFLAFDFDEAENPRIEASWRPDNAEDAVVKVGGTTVVQFSHFSVKEFLTSNRIARGRVARYYIPLEPAHLTITRACLTVLLLLDSSSNRATIKNLPLAFYAARFWVDHAKFGDVSLHVQDAIRRVFDPVEPYLSTWSWLTDHDEIRYSISETPTTSRLPPLRRALLHGLFDVAEWLITSRSQDPDELYRYKTLLHTVSGGGQLEMARWLIKHGADPNATRNVGWRPLQIASKLGHLEILRLLIGSGADVDVRANSWTALLLAVDEGHLDVLRFLLENGADPNVRGWKGTPLDCARESGHLEFVQLLIEYGAK